MTFFSSITAFDVVVEAIGVLGIIASVISFQCKKHNRLLLFRSANESLFALQYGLLGAYTGMAMNIIGVVRNLVFTKLVEKNKNTMPARYIFSAIFVVFIAVTWSGFKSALSGTAKVISTFAYGSTNFALTRVLIFITSTSWFIYNLLVKSYAGCACELLTLGSIVVSLVRYKSNKKKAAVAALSTATEPTEIAENAEVAATDSEQTDVGEPDTKIENAEKTLSSSESVSLPSKTAEPRDGNEDNTETDRENNTDKLPKEQYKS